MQKNTKNARLVEKKEPANTKPRENYGFHFSSAIKITEPSTGKVLLHKRCN